MMMELYTIGHSNTSAEDFLSLLKQNNITVLVDVRSAPYSKYVPHFSKRNLEGFIISNGLDYRYAGTYLGGMPDDQSVYEVSNGKKQTNYLKVMQLEIYKTGIKRLLEIITETDDGGVAIMCAEADPYHCHRHNLIVRSLLDTHHKIIDVDIKVKHILKDGSTATVPAETFNQHHIKQERLL